jgi:putative transposase
MVPQIWSSLCPQHPAEATSTNRSLVSRRDGDRDGKAEVLSLRAVDSEGEVLDFLVQRRRNTRAAERLMRKLLKRQGFALSTITTDKLASYGAAKKNLGLHAVHEQGLRQNNRCENSHLPVRRREQKQQRFKSPGSAQRFLNAHAAVYKLFNIDRHLTSRRTVKEFRGQAFRQWRELATAA